MVILAYSKVSSGTKRGWQQNWHICWWMPTAEEGGAGGGEGKGARKKSDDDVRPSRAALPPILLLMVTHLFTHSPSNLSVLSIVEEWGGMGQTMF